ncbi:MAG: hypothetical protein DMF34_04405 [Verrucomicrobia bacterium]|nr:MAG: hypothetical protein DMF34_04405 [Verrucomicrobiota bacterium]
MRNGGEFAAVLAAQTHSRRGAIDYERRVAVLAAEKDVGIDCFLRSDRVALCMTNEVAVVLCRTVSGEHRLAACAPQSSPRVALALSHPFKAVKSRRIVSFWPS